MVICGLRSMRCRIWMELCTTKALFGGASRSFCFSKKLQKPKASPNEVCYFQKQKLEKLILHCQSKSSSRAASRASTGEPFSHSFPSLLLHAVLDALPPAVPRTLTDCRPPTPLSAGAPPRHHLRHGCCSGLVGASSPERRWQGRAPWPRLGAGGGELPEWRRQGRAPWPQLKAGGGELPLGGAAGARGCRSEGPSCAARARGRRGKAPRQQRLRADGVDLPCAAQLGLVAGEATSRGVEDEIPRGAAKAPSRAGVPPQHNKRILRISPK